MRLTNLVIPSLLATITAASPQLQAGPRDGTSVSASTGCGKPPPVRPGHWYSAETAGGREYRIWLPQSYDPGQPTPLILSYHGATRNIAHQIRADRLSDPAFNDDHLVAYLQGARRDAPDPRSTTWQGAPDAPEGVDDVAFTAAVLDAAEALLCVDAARVYATGHSQGGGFIGARLACDAATSGRIAAFAPVSGAFYNASVDRASRCDPPHLENACEAPRTRTQNGSRTPMLELHGGADDVISFHGGFRKGACLPAIRHWAKDWARRNRLELRDDVVPVEGTRNGVQYAYGDGLVTLVYAGDDVGHVWMSRDAGNADLDASAWIMDFFRKYSLD
ncbi:hypothetical protein DL770_006655 [Monosporascus sp. CRB-9-2]|nr:hypothetical protein DL770_006655 [Monosporascus sp. CRB-9-2]